MRNARAVDLLRAHTKWPAPIAQNAGLTVPLICNIARDETCHNLVVFIDVVLDVNTLTFTAGVDLNAEIARLMVTTPDDSTFNISTGIVERYDVPMISLQLPAPAPNNAAFAVPRSAILQHLSRGIASRFEQVNLHKCW